MNQIALGDSSGGGSWLVLSGEGIAAPFKGVDYRPVFGTGETIEESLILILEGTPAELAGALRALEYVRLRQEHYTLSGYPERQCLRFQMEAGGAYYYAPLLELAVEVNPDAPETRLTGSLLVRLHFTRPNHFDSDPVELPLTGKAGEDVLGGLSLINHTDYHAGHGNSVLIKTGDIDSDLPAPLRIELTNTYADGVLHDLYLGIYHHPDVDDEDSLFYPASVFIGGYLYTNVNAINERYVRAAWADTDWAGLGHWLVQNAAVRDLAGLAYRPILHLYNLHSYSDLHLKIKLQAGSNILWEGEPVYADPDYGYVLFPAVQVPPSRLLNETLPHHIEITLYAQRDTAGTHTLDFDNLTLLPLDPGANFIAFYDLPQDAVLVDDGFMGVHNTQFSAIGSETVSHVRQGGKLLVRPGEHNRLVILMANGDDRMDIFRTARLRVFYRKRKAVL
ncbi:MAG: hypothetical protein H0S79_10715 [Anaerolineaceae bacterium]|nr:hypothetical protein [Anaerolineaceae bacterium]